ncbi:acyl-CoA dehydrogenase family member 10 [Roseibium sp. TrichSKD4]|uniref:phosphotransferase family protein n=1 Tax=Roseibium sp. TrichSKD4 TaxID=744980 RepID=UPI0001E567A3|nr:phosphotransferase family protein [Roseibium sp. TrichSKD4]EFO31225.1 acyl-CoA dehydrogenase family member 10 [Roseibium sp. TrichSKD4]
MTSKEMPVDLDIGRLSKWLAANLPHLRGPFELAQISGGQSNPTYRLKTKDRALILRRKPFGALLKSAHAIDREFRVQRALSGSSVPVPKILALCEDDGVIGSMFYLMEEVDGRAFDDPRVPGETVSNRTEIYSEMARVLSAIHSVDLDAVGLTDYGPDGNYYARQISRWSRQYKASETEPIPAMNELIVWLEANQPEDDGRRTLVHGDFRIDNLLFAPDEETCVAVLDWELSTLGHPFADLAALVMQWGRPTGPDSRGLRGVDRKALGIPLDAEFIADYCAQMGIDKIPNFGFYVAFCAFRMAAILQGVKKRALDGNGADPERGLQLGRHVPGFAEDGLRAASEVFPK